LFKAAGTTCGLFFGEEKMSVPAAYTGVIMIWATTPLAIKWSGESVGFLFGVSARMLIGLVVIAVLMLLLRRPLSWNRQAMMAYAGVAMAIYGAMTLVYWGAQFIPSGLVSVLFGLTPVVTGLIAGLWLGERVFTPYKVTGIALGLMGLGLIFGLDFNTEGQGLLGLLAVVLAVIVHAFSVVWVKKADAQVSALELTAGGLLLANVLFLLTWTASGESLPVAVPDKALWSIVYLGVFGSVLGFVLFYYALKRLQASTMALLTLITPVLALMLGRVLNNESIGFVTYMGSGMILLGLVLYQAELMRVICKE
jgi:drug/metabolite transporter (DMT)-like permease